MYANVRYIYVKFLNIFPECKCECKYDMTVPQHDNVLIGFTSVINVLFIFVNKYFACSNKKMTAKIQARV